MANRKSIIQKYTNLKWLLPILVVVVLLLLFKMYTHNSEDNNTNYQATSVTPTIFTNNWKPYEDQANGYSIKYPENWSYKEVVTEEGTSIRFYENGMPERQTYRMVHGNEQLMLSVITNQTLKELGDNTKIQQTTIAGKPAIKLSTGAYVELNPNLILSIHSSTYPQPAMEEILNNLVVKQ